MIEWLKWLIARKEMQELHRWRTQHDLYIRWLCMFPEIGVALMQLREEVNQGKVRFIHEVREEIAHLRDSNLHFRRPTPEEDEYTRRTVERGGIW